MDSWCQLKAPRLNAPEAHKSAALGFCETFNRAGKGQSGPQITQITQINPVESYLR